MIATRVHRVIATPLDGEPVEFGALQLTVVPPSLNNLFVNGKKGRFKSPDYKIWQIKALQELRKQNGWHVAGAIKIRVTFNNRQTKADLDNLIKPTLDLLMAAGRISDDRNVRRIEAEFSPNIIGTLIEIRRVDLPEKAPEPKDRSTRKAERAIVTAALGAFGIPLHATTGRAA